MAARDGAEEEVAMRRIGGGKPANDSRSIRGKSNTRTRMLILRHAIRETTSSQAIEVQNETRLQLTAVPVIAMRRSFGYTWLTVSGVTSWCFTNTAGGTARR